MISSPRFLKNSSSLLLINEKNSNSQTIQNKKKDFFITNADPHMNKKIFNNGVLNQINLYSDAKISQKNSQIQKNRKAYESQMLNNKAIINSIPD